MSGYVHCACRDCMETAIATSEEPAFCHDCEEFGCGHDKECEVPPDYETCGECGFDHSYEYEQAHKAHSESPSV